MTASELDAQRVTVRSVASASFLVVRSEDLVVIMQRGYFDTSIMDSMIEAVDATTSAVLAETGRAKTVHLADIRELSGVSLVARVKFERWGRRNARRIAKTAIISNSRPIEFLASLVGSFAPSFRWRIVRSLPDALEALERPPGLLPELEAAILQGSWTSTGNDTK